MINIPLPNKDRTDNAELNRERKILVIEDDQALSELLEDIFSDSGYEVRICHKTDNILPIAEEFLPDLVLTDYLLPLINGGELCSQIKRNPKTAHIPVIIFSAYSKVLHSLGDYGCDAVISKPFDLDKLLKQVDYCINKSSLS